MAAPAPQTMSGAADSGDNGPAHCDIFCPCTCKTLSRPIVKDDCLIFELRPNSCFLWAFAMHCCVSICIGCAKSSIDKYVIRRDGRCTIYKRYFWKVETKELTGVRSAMMTSHTSHDHNHHTTTTYAVSLIHSGGTHRLSRGTDNMDVSGKEAVVQAVNQFLGASNVGGAANPLAALMAMAQGGALQTAMPQQMGMMGGFGGMGGGAGAGMGMGMGGGGAVPAAGAGSMGSGPLNLDRAAMMFQSIPPPRTLSFSRRDASGMVTLYTATFTSPRTGLTLEDRPAGLTVTGMSPEFNREEGREVQVGDLVLAINPVTSASSVTEPVMIQNVVSAMQALQAIPPPRELVFSRGIHRYSVVFTSQKLGLGMRQTPLGVMVTGFEPNFNRAEGSAIQVGDALVSIGPASGKGGGAASPTSPSPGSAPPAAASPNAWFRPAFEGAIAAIRGASTTESLKAGFDGLEGLLRAAPPSELTDTVHEQLLGVASVKRSAVAEAWTAEVAASYGAALKTFESRKN